jgi:hypothetical protein
MTDCHESDPEPCPIIENTFYKGLKKIAIHPGRSKTVAVQDRRKHIQWRRYFKHHSKAPLKDIHAIQGNRRNEASFHITSPFQ